ncbi:MAG: helix-turn-helix transcriptional regulator [Clostridium perfringens]|uniref:helix-turn-helix transcriptional regulator n=1 Tax=Clostridium sp. TaxID=1506 RepID=UPI001ABA8B99|nr:helix-turn-helix transcriptional regulator [Clostridium perfringens]EJT6154420.1 helix-turn-helix transcriptional regulator [Clostridium perfringens]MBO3395866.1 helix-turn-helix transcriptional regulator [Clostridium perfringens]MBO3402519.1 helix-turn-helix transcriptional regulator [Clostridium perfringens]MDG6890898.1 anaerobic benzoate catabolism transcriptional regulator [Clostridium perfringens]MDK0686777.1 helix-turn-helix transcriptional regulator [Clostridium perfringens]
MNLKIQRIKMKKKQKEIAKEVGITQQYLANLENGKSKNPSRDLMIKLAAALDTTVQELFFSDEE